MVTIYNVLYNYLFIYFMEVFKMEKVKEMLLNLNLKMLSLGKPIEKDDIGYNKPDFLICQRYLTYLSDYEAYELAKTLKKYTKTQLSLYEEDILNSIEFFEKKLGKGNYKNKIRKYEIDISFENKDFAIIYIKNLPYQLQNCKFIDSYMNTKYLYKIPYTYLFSIVKLLNLMNYKINDSIFEKIKELNLSENEEIEKIILDNIEKIKRQSYILKKNEELEDDESIKIEIYKDDKDERLLYLDYPRYNYYSQNDIYSILRNLNKDLRVYFFENDVHDFALKYKGVHEFLEILRDLNKDGKKKFNFECLLKYEDFCNQKEILKISIQESNNMYNIKIPYEPTLVSIIKSLSRKDRSWDSDLKCWKIKKNCIVDLYLLLRDCNINNKDLNLKDFDKYVDINNLNDLTYTLNFEYKSGIRNLALYEINLDIKNIYLESIINKYGKLNVNNNYLIYESNLKKLYLDLNSQKKYKVNLESLKQKIDEINELNKQKYFLIDTTNLSKKPLPHQIPAIEEMLKMKRFLLCDEMGLGKTYETILWAASIPFKKVIVCPKSLKLNWKKEILEIFPNAEVKLLTNKSFTDLKTNDGWLILNYEIVHHHIDNIKNNDFKVLAFDEGHYLKNVGINGVCKTQRGKSCLELSKYFEYKAVLTGTPIPNKIKDIWNLLVIIEHPLTQNFYYFTDTFCDGFNNGYGYCFDGASNLDLLNEELKPFMIRRLKKDILNLPEKIRTFIPNRISLKEYNKKLQEYKKSKNILSYDKKICELNSLKLILAIEKTKTTIEMVKDYIDQGESVVVFSNYTKPLNMMKEFFDEKAAIYDGNTTEKEGQKIVEDFQNGNIKVFLGNIKAAGVGLTLTKSHILFFNDYDWLPSNHLQAEDRIHRISQECISNIFYNYASNAPMDDFLTKLLNEKLKNSSLVIDGVSKDFTNESMIEQLVDFI